MLEVVVKFARWLLTKFGAAALIVLLGLAAFGLWLFLRDNLGVDGRRGEELQRLGVERQRLVAAKAAVEERIVKFKAEAAVQQHRLEQAAKVMAALRELESWWDRLFGNRAQQSANAEQVKRLQEIQAESKSRLSDLKAKITQTNWEKDGVEIALQRVEGEIRRVEETQSVVVHYWHRAWVQARWYVFGALAAYFLGPTVWALAMYFGFAAFAMRGRPIRLAAATPVLPQVGASRVSIVAVLRGDEVLRIKEKFLQASDEGVKKSTRFVLDWSIPFTSVACGLTELVELRPEQNATDYHVTLSNADDPHIELALVEVPAGSSLILRPSYLAGVVQRGGAPLRIRRHWALWRWQSWISGQFRFFEFIGPCRLVVAGSRGVRAEVLAEREGVAAPARRTNQDATIGFTPNLDYRPVRAETFWSYYRGMNPLFDDLFSGQGMFLLQETSTPGGAAKAGRFWSAVWSGVLKVFGL
jgi:hypothetical protein